MPVFGQRPLVKVVFAQQRAESYVGFYCEASGVGKGFYCLPVKEDGRVGLFGFLKQPRRFIHFFWLLPVCPAACQK